MIICNISNITDNKTRYIIIKFNRFEFLYVKKPMTDNKKKAYKWFDEIKKFRVI